MSKKFHFTSLGEEATICGRCGYCRDVCPAYKVGGWESFSPRGKIALVNVIREGQYPQKLIDRVYQCTLCGACREVCHVNIDTREMWIKMRQKIASSGKAPEGMYQLKDIVLDKGNISGDEATNRELWAEEVTDTPGELFGRKNAEIMLYLGCVSSLYPAAYSIPQSIIKLLRKAEVDFTTLGGEEVCCGFPLLGAGFTDEILQLAEKNVAKMDELSPRMMVVSCPSCLHTWKHEYPRLLGKELPFEVLHISEYLLHLLQQGRLKLRGKNQTVTYHDPCDLGRNNGIYEEPREILRSIPGVTLIEMVENRENSLCCGGGGNLEMTDKNMAEGIAQLKLEMIKTTGATTVVSSCQQCKRNISGAVRKAKMRVKVQDLTEFLVANLEE